MVIRKKNKTPSTLDLTQILLKLIGATSLFGIGLLDKVSWGSMTYKESVRTDFSCETGFSGIAKLKVYNSLYISTAIN